jgi:D-alanyl-D-alanine carboxypeptidase
METSNVSTALDVARLGRYAFSNATVQRAASTARYRFAVRSSGEVKSIVNTNDLLVADADAYVVGGKTGYLDESLYNLVVKLRYPLGRRGVKGDVIVVVLGSPARRQSFASAKALAEWAWLAHEWPQTVSLSRR